MNSINSFLRTLWFNWILAKVFLFDLGQKRHQKLNRRETTSKWIVIWLSSFLITRSRKSRSWSCVKSIKKLKVSSWRRDIESKSNLTSKKWNIWSMSKRRPIRISTRMVRRLRLKSRITSRSEMKILRRIKVSSKIYTATTRIPTFSPLRNSHSHIHDSKEEKND